jgi:hypothetical protein
VIIFAGNTESLPLLSGLIELVALDHGHDQVHLHQLLLLGCQVLVGLQLLLNSFTELIPVKVANQLFDVVLINLIGVLESTHVDFDKIFMLDGLGKVELRL